jgi:hypothetical protein
MTMKWKVCHHFMGHGTPDVQRTELGGSEIYEI